MTFTIFFIIILFMALIQTFIPYFVKRTVIFGVTIPEQNRNDEKLSLYKKSYSLIVFLVSVIALGIYTIWAFISNPTEEVIVLTGVMIEFGIIFISMSFYFFFHGKTAQYKRLKNFTELKQVQMVDLGVRSKDEMLPWYVFLLPALITVGLIAYTIFQYDILPDQIPTHWGPNGKADAFTAKTPFSAISMLVVLLVMQVMFFGINAGTRNSGIKLSATGTNASRDRQLTLRKYSSWFMFLTSVLITMMMSFFQLTTIHPDVFSNGVMFAVPFIFLLVVLFGTVIFAVKVGSSDKRKIAEVGGKFTDYDEDEYWKGGLIYFNRNDPSIFVEKRFGVGWTINFANPIGYLIVIVPVAIILLFSFL